MYVFSKWLTQGDQLELVQKDMESARRFNVARHKLSGLEKEEGSLVVGVTALTFLNKEGDEKAHGLSFGLIVSQKETCALCILIRLSAAT